MLSRAAGRPHIGFVSPRLAFIVATLASTALALIIPALFWDQGLVETETTTHARQYSDDSSRTLVERVFDPHANDLGTYQARELSYLVDLVDARAYPVLAAAFGPAHSIPLSAWAASLIIVIAFQLTFAWDGARFYPIATLLLWCLLTSFCFVVTMGMHYRSAKSMLAAVAMAYVCLVVRAAAQPARLATGRWRPTWRGVASLVLALAAGLLDRQGTFLVVIAAAVLWIHTRRSRSLADIRTATVAAALLLQVYNFAVAPAIIWTVNDYWPDFSYQRIPPGELLRLHSHVLKAAALLGANTLLVFGGNWLVAPLFAGAAALWWIRYRPDSRGATLIPYAGLLLASQLLMFALMIARHGYIYRWTDHRYWYYPLPFLVLALAALTRVALSRWPSLPERRRAAIAILLLIVVASNVLSLESRRREMLTGEWFGPVYLQSHLYRTALRSGVDDPQLSDVYKALVHHRRRQLASY